MQLLAGPDHVVPLAMESVRLDPQRTKLSLRHLLAGRIAATIEPRAHDEAAAVAGVADEVDDRLVGPQGTTAPVDRDEREEAVLDLVPLARARREVADTDRHAELVGDSLELVLPHVRPVAVAAARVGGDEELSRFGVALRADLGPPRLDRGDGKDRRVVVDADADEAVVGGEVIHAVRNRLADRVGREVVDVDQFGLALRIPLAPRVLEVADQFLLLGVDGDDRHTALDAVLGLGVDVLELRVAIRVLGAFDGLVRRLQAVAVVAKEPGDRPVADLDVVLREQFLGQHHRALARPAQRRLGVAACDRVDELLERGPHLGVQDFERSLAGTTPNLDDVLGPRARACLVSTLAHRADRHSGRARHHGHAAVPDRTRLRARPKSPRAFIHGRLQQAPLLAYRLLRVHGGGRSRRPNPVDPSPVDFDADSIDSPFREPLAPPDRQLSPPTGRRQAVQARTRRFAALARRSSRRSPTIWPRTCSPRTPRSRTSGRPWWRVQTDGSRRSISASSSWPARSSTGSAPMRTSASCT